MIPTFFLLTFLFPLYWFYSLLLLLLIECPATAITAIAVKPPFATAKYRRKNRKIKTKLLKGNLLQSVHITLFHILILILSFFNLQNSTYFVEPFVVCSCQNILVTLSSALPVISVKAAIGKIHFVHRNQTPQQDMYDLKYLLYTESSL